MVFKQTLSQKYVDERDFDLLNLKTLNLLNKYKRCCQNLERSLL